MALPRIRLNAQNPSQEGAGSTLISGLAATLLLLALLLPGTAASEALAPAAFFPETEYDFGEIGTGKTISHAFSVKNTGNAPLIIESVKTG